MINNDSDHTVNYGWSIDVSASGCKGDTVFFDYIPAGTISETGSGQDYMPPYMTLYCWQRTA